MVGVVAAYSGVHRTDPIDDSDSAAGYSDRASTPSVTTTVSNAVLVHVFTKRQETLPAPVGTSAR
jgi:hypothetical protein